MAQAIVYSSTNCNFCKQLKTYLTEQNISFEERNIDEKEEYFHELSRLGMMSVPLTLIGEKQILGFNPTRIKKVLTALEEAAK
ncbi:glutaredoxin family protein [Brevibacillus porteri]|uniref:NrdH-redoxin n=1 Tax=Brevibacillus porteri TaxID=2126350 RepID=A0ABX5FWE1_9BACL|nr:glutaredoxin family protein [Brevibacillus porteri]MED1797645.1 glutaredoxin family protein [Brevibacillus porteri]MED2130615.1 glutaredoxin family protein [Brevibacillus porteri]MED2746213.1 glutaredoxin family protein [Brevibacillus porteri]MED2818007.1 glutaredoxin family protein [Brevibacillus porteri]MED2895172.1 glutaredoxin family protein [Brevibacillus porteri]